MTGSRMRSLDLTWFQFQPFTNKDSQVAADATTCVPGLRHLATYELKSPKTVKQEQIRLLTNWFWIYSPRDNTTDKHNRSAQQTCFEHLEPNKSRAWRLTWKEGCLYIWKYRSCLTVNFKVTWRTHWNQKPPHGIMFVAENGLHRTFQLHGGRFETSATRWRGASFRQKRTAGRFWRILARAEAMEDFRFWSHPHWRRNRLHPPRLLHPRVPLWFLPSHFSAKLLQILKLCRTWLSWHRSY